MRDRRAPPGGHPTPRGHLTCHPLTIFLTAPQLHTADNNFGLAMEPAHVHGRQTTLVLAALRSTIDMGRAADLSARIVYSYLLTCLIPRPPPDLTNF
jgi:hypothetical protein